MELIVGGAFQGQLEYAKKLHPECEWQDGASCSWEELCAAKGVYNFQEFIRRALKDERDVAELAKELLVCNGELLIVSDEVGYGVVTIDAFERRYRETVGRVCTELAAASSRVHRVICGIGTVIKDA